MSILAKHCPISRRFRFELLQRYPEQIVIVKIKTQEIVFQSTNEEEADRYWTHLKNAEQYLRISNMTYQD